MQLYVKQCKHVRFASTFITNWSVDICTRNSTNYKISSRGRVNLYRWFIRNSSFGLQIQLNRCFESRGVIIKTEPKPHDWDAQATNFSSQIESTNWNFFELFATKSTYITLVLLYSSKQIQNLQLNKIFSEMSTQMTTACESFVTAV